jgi:KaiC/GvpD/RAD55 family RecA-like ATPase
MFYSNEKQIVASLTIGQLREFLRELLTNETRPVETEKKNLVYGLRGIMSLLHCSHTQAQRYKDGILKDAVIQYGRKIVVDADKALALFKENSSSKAFWLLSHRQLCNFVMVAVSGENKPSEAEVVEEAGAAKEPEETFPAQVGMLQIDHINDIITRAKEKPLPDDLFLGLWNEGEVACLFSDSNVGKSILALQIAEEVAKKQAVIYFDFEMSDTQLQLRYSDETDTHEFPDNLYRGSINPFAIAEGDFETALIQNIEAAAVKINAKVLIIDNLTYMCNDSEKGDSAGSLMMRLMRLKHKYGWSLLVIAHTPKRNESDPIEPRHLAGSKKLFNFFDSVFAIGRSSTDPSYRYLKHLKVRSGEIVYGANNVLVLQLDKAADGNLHYLNVGEETEEKQLKDTQSWLSCDEETLAKVLSMREEGKSYRDIEKGIEGMSKTRAQRICSEYMKHQSNLAPWETPQE